MSTWKEWQKKLDDLAKRATTQRVGPLVLIDTGTWPLEDRLAYQDDTKDDRVALEDKYAGDMSPVVGGPRVVAIVVVSPISPPDDDDDDMPTVNRWAESQARQEQAIRELQPAVNSEPDDDPQDAEPWGDPQEVLYQHPQFGPVRRAEHQLRRQRRKGL